MKDSDAVVMKNQIVIKSRAELIPTISALLGLGTLILGSKPNKAVIMNHRLAKMIQELNYRKDCQT